jgi:levanase/fructan beta-fructosidase
MTIPRELVLVKEGSHYIVSSKPVKELQNYMQRLLKKTNL